MKNHLIATFALILVLSANTVFSQAPKKHHKATKHTSTRHKTTAKKNTHSTKKVSGEHKKNAIKHPHTKATAHYKKTVRNKHKKYAASRHHAVKKSASITSKKTITIDDHSATSVVEIRNGNVYINDELVYSIKNVKKDDQKIIINYISPTTAATVANTTDQNKETQVATPQGRVAILGIKACNYFENGVIIEDILPGSPAEDAGLFPGNVITNINGKEISNLHEFIRVINSYGPGDNITITYNNENETETAHVVLADKEKMEDCNCFETEAPFARQ